MQHSSFAVSLGLPVYRCLIIGADEARLRQFYTCRHPVVPAASSLQTVMNTATRLMFYNIVNMTTLHRLHWLRAPERILSYKLAVLVYRCVHGLALTYPLCSLSLTSLVDDACVFHRLRHLMYHRVHACVSLATEHFSSQQQERETVYRRK